MDWAAHIYCDQKSIYALINVWLGFFTHVTTLRVQYSSVGRLSMKGELSCVHRSDFCLTFYVGDKIERAFKRATFDLDMLISFEMDCCTDCISIVTRSPL